MDGGLASRRYFIANRLMHGMLSMALSFWISTLR